MISISNWIEPSKLNHCFWNNEHPFYVYEVIKDGVLTNNTLMQNLGKPFDCQWVPKSGSYVFKVYAFAAMPVFKGKFPWWSLDTPTLPVDVGSVEFIIP